MMLVIMDSQYQQRLLNLWFRVQGKISLIKMDIQNLELFNQNLILTWPLSVFTINAKLH